MDMRSPKVLGTNVVPLLPAAPSTHLGERHDLLCALASIRLAVNGLKAVCIDVHQSPGNDVAVAGRLHLVDLRRTIYWEFREGRAEVSTRGGNRT